MQYISPQLKNKNSGVMILSSSSILMLAAGSCGVSAHMLAAAPCLGISS